jgi:hypothetical protein
MRVFTPRTTSAVAAAFLMAGAGFVATGASPARAATTDVHTCSGSPSAPGVLTGSYDSVRVSGFCVVNQGPATVSHDLNVLPGGVLVASFGLNDKTGRGHSRLTVGGDLHVGKGATLLLGCLPTSSPCLDDPDPNNPTLSSPGRVGGDLSSEQPLGVIVHNSRIGGDVRHEGGGGGFTCQPSGFFAFIGSPVFSAYEDSSIGGDLRINGVTSCWLGVTRTTIGGDARFINNQLHDKDAIEIETNTIGGDLACDGNSRVWDGHELSEKLFPRADSPNTVHGARSGQCVLSSKTTEDGQKGPGPF